MRTFKALVGFTMLAALAGFMLTASPAAAHDTCTTYSPYGYGCVYQSHRTIQACDTRSDSIGVHVNFRTASTSGGVGDTNGSQAGCGYGYSSAPVTQYQVCAFNHGCTAWRST